MGIGVFRRWISRLLPPNRLFVASFASAILVGALLLFLPSSAARGRLRFIDALFTSTSAVCVTGLVVVETGKDLSWQGQVITLSLIQVGGLGIITFSTVLFILMGRGISLKGREIVQSTFLYSPRRDLLAIVKWVLLFTFVAESAGSILLWLRLSRDFAGWSSLYLSVFHAVSAFNNAGFSLFPDSLVRYRGDLLVNLVMMGLIVHGGLGFIVQYELLHWLKGTQKRLSLHTKIVLLTTAVMILSGAFLFYLFEREYILNDLPAIAKVLVCLFQSVTPRTAGFNTVDIGQLTNPTLLLLMVLMFVGASPGSTGGGIKTTSAAMVALAMWNRAKGSTEVNVFNRTIPREVVTRSILIIFASAFCIGIVWSVLISSGDRFPVDQSRHLFVKYLFEAISAFGTVGLSMGVTPGLSCVQKLGLILLMFAGRVGPLTLAFSLARQAEKVTITYSEEGVMVG